MDDLVGQAKPDEKAHPKSDTILVEETDPSLIYSGGSPYNQSGSSDWKLLANEQALTVASGGTAVYSDKVGASLKFSFRGDQLGIQFLTAAQPAAVNVTIDGVESKILDVPASGSSSDLFTASSPREAIRFVFSPLECGTHTVHVKNQPSSNATASDHGRRVIFDAFSYVSSGAQGCSTFASRTSNPNVEVTRETPAPTASSSASEQSHTSDSTRVAGIVVAGIVTLSFALILTAWLIRCKSKREREMERQRRLRDGPYCDQMRDRRKRLSEVVARYQETGYLDPARRLVDPEAPLHGPGGAFRERPYLHPSALASTKGWGPAAIDNSSVRSSVKSGLTTPRMNAANGELYDSYFSVPYDRPHLHAPPPTYPSPLHSPSAQEGLSPWSQQQRRVEFIGAQPGTPPVQQGAHSGPIRPILLKASSSRPWTAPDVHMTSTSSALSDRSTHAGVGNTVGGNTAGSVLSATPSPASTPDTVIQRRTSSLSPRSFAGRAAKRPNTASAVEHFNRSKEWVEIDRPLSSIVARSSSIRPLKLGEKSAPEDVKRQSTHAQTADDTEPLRLPEAMPIERQSDHSPTTPISSRRPSRELLRHAGASPRRPPKSPLRSADPQLGVEGTFKNPWGDQTHTEADEQIMWRTPPTSNVSSPSVGKSSLEDPSRCSASAYNHRTSSSGDVFTVGRVYPLGRAMDERRSLTIDTSFRRASHEEDKVERLIEQLEDHVLTHGEGDGRDSNEQIEKMAEDQMTISTVYSRPSFEVDGDTVRSEVGTIQSIDRATFRSDTTAMGFIAPRRK